MIAAAPMTRSHATVPGARSAKRPTAIAAPRYWEIPPATKRASGGNRPSRVEGDEACSVVASYAPARTERAYDADRGGNDGHIRHGPRSSRRTRSCAQTRSADARPIDHDRRRGARRRRPDRPHHGGHRSLGRHRSRDGTGTRGARRDGGPRRARRGQAGDGGRHDRLGPSRRRARDGRRRPRRPRVGAAVGARAARPAQRHRRARQQRRGHGHPGARRTSTGPPTVSRPSSG